MTEQYCTLHHMHICILHTCKKLGTSGTEYGPAEDDAALHRLLHEVRGECGEGGVHDEGDQEHEDREPGDRDQGEGEGGVEPDRLPRRPGRRLLLLLLGQCLNKVIHSPLDPVT